MINAKKHIKSARYILLMWFLLFALSPCIVKEALFNAVDVAYTKSYNKTKATANTNFCQYTQNSKKVISITKQSKIKYETEVFSSWKNPDFVVESVKIQSSYAKNYPCNIPPKYILYKRLKVDVA
jgi:hypothetical protein